MTPGQGLAAIVAAALSLFALGWFLPLDDRLPYALGVVAGIGFAIVVVLVDQDEGR